MEVFSVFLSLAFYLSACSVCVLCLHVNFFFCFLLFLILYLFMDIMLYAMYSVTLFFSCVCVSVPVLVLFIKPSCMGLVSCNSVKMSNACKIFLSNLYNQFWWTNPFLMFLSNFVYAETNWMTVFDLYVYACMHACMQAHKCKKNKKKKKTKNIADSRKMNCRKYFTFSSILYNNKWNTKRDMSRDFFLFKQNTFWLQIFLSSRCHQQRPINTLKCNYFVIFLFSVLMHEYSYVCFLGWLVDAHKTQCEGRHNDSDEVAKK